MPTLKKRYRYIVIMLIRLAFFNTNTKIKSVNPALPASIPLTCPLPNICQLKIANPAHIIWSVERYRESANWSTSTTPGRDWQCPVNQCSKQEAACAFKFCITSEKVESFVKLMYSNGLAKKNMWKHCNNFGKPFLWY